MNKTVKRVILTLLLLALSASTALLSYLYFYAPGDKNLSGKWTADLDMTERAAVTALDWLQDIEAVSVTLDDMERYMRGLSVQMDLTLVQTARFEGTFLCSILPESYDACMQAAYEAFAEAFQDLLAERLQMAGYEGDTDRENVERLIAETFGMSTVSYLMACGPALLPTLEELQAWYDGSGTYENADGILIRYYEKEGNPAAKTESYIRQDDRLVLTGETDSAGDGFFLNYYPAIYTLKQPE